MAPILKVLGSMLCAYLCACIVVVLLYQTSDDFSLLPNKLAGGMLITTLTSLPGFVVLRLLLWTVRCRHLFWFAVTGGANGIVALSMFRERLAIDPYFALMGLAAGAAYWLVERAIAGGILVRRDVQTA